MHEPVAMDRVPKVVPPKLRVHLLAGSEAIGISTVWETFTSHVRMNPSPLALQRTFEALADGRSTFILCF